MSLSSDTLCAAELNAERASVQELRQRMDDVIALRFALGGHDLAHANALLMRFSALLNVKAAPGLHGAPIGV